MKGVFRFLVLPLCLTYPLSAQQTITVSTSYQNLLSNSEGTGMLDLIVTEAFRRIGIRADIIYTPTEQSLHDVNAGVLEAEINRVEGMEAQYPNLLRVPEPNMVMHFVAFSNRNLAVDGWDSLKAYDIGLVRGWKILEEHTAGQPGVYTLPTEVELFTMLDKGRIDAALYADLTGYAALRDLGIRGVRHLEPPLASRNMYLYLHRSRAELAEKLASALRDMKADGTYDAITADVRRRYGLPLSDN